MSPKIGRWTSAPTSSTNSAMNRDRSKQLFAEAKQVIPGGVNSPVRAFRGVGGDPVFFARGEGLCMHRKTPLASENVARWYVRLGVAAAALNGQPIALFARHKLDHDVIGDHAYRERVDNWYPAIQRRGRCGAGIRGKRGHHCGDETEAPSAERTRGREKRGCCILSTGTEQHAILH